LNSGGHPEIVGAGGVLFEDENSFMKAIKKVKENYKTYHSSINLRDITEIAQVYYDFICDVYQMKFEGRIKNKKVNHLNYLLFCSSDFYGKARKKFRSNLKKMNLS